MDRKCSDTVVFLGVPRYFTLHYNAVDNDSSKSALQYFIIRRKSIKNSVKTLKPAFQELQTQLCKLASLSFG